MDFFKFMFSPSFWIRNYSTNKILDESLSRGIDESGVHIIDRHYCKIGETVVWIANYPYAYGTVKGVGGMPSRSTVNKLREAVTKELCKFYE